MFCNESDYFNEFGVSFLAKLYQIMCMIDLTLVVDHLTPPHCATNKAIRFQQDCMLHITYIGAWSSVIFV